MTMQKNIVVWHFNSQPRKGADLHIWDMSFSLKNFNSQPREGADGFSIECSILEPISTHSPARGLTNAHPFSTHFSVLISTHSPARGLTRSREGLGDRKVISTHSPARGLTVRCSVCCGCHTHFNSQPREGADTLYAIKHYYWYHFNSQPREGADSNFSQKYCLTKIVFCTYFTYFY